MAKLVQVVSVAAFDSKGRLLMGKRQDCGLWTCPGGHLEDGEKPARAAVRELIEETGLRPGSGGLEYLGSKVVRDKIEVHSFKTTGVKGKATGEDDPDQECQTWKWLDVEDGLPEEQEQNLYNAQDVTLEFLGFQKGPVRKFQAPPPLGQRLSKADDPLTPHHVLWDQLLQDGWFQHDLVDEGQPPHTRMLLHPTFWHPGGDGQYWSDSQGMKTVRPQEMVSMMTAGPGAKSWTGTPAHYQYARFGEVGHLPHTDFDPQTRAQKVVAAPAEDPAPAAAPILKAWPKSREENEANREAFPGGAAHQVMEDQLLEHGARIQPPHSRELLPISPGVDKKGKPVKDTAARQARIDTASAQQGTLRQPFQDMGTSLPQLPAGSRSPAEGFAAEVPKHLQPLGVNVPEIRRRSADAQVQDRIWWNTIGRGVTRQLLHQVPPLEIQHQTQHGLQTRRLGFSIAPDARPQEHSPRSRGVIVAHDLDEPDLGFSTVGFQGYDDPFTEPNRGASRHWADEHIPAMVAHLRQHLPVPDPKLYKGWPRNDQENEANRQGFVRESPPTEDRLMEQGLSDKKVQGGHRFRDEDEVPLQPPPELTGGTVPRANQNRMQAASDLNWEQNRHLGSGRLGGQSSWEGMDEEILNQNFLPPDFQGLRFVHRVQKNNSGFQNGRQMGRGHYITAYDRQNGHHAATFMVNLQGQLERWSGESHSQITEPIRQHLQAFLGQYPDMNKSETLKKTAVDQAQERLRASKLVLLAEPLAVLEKLDRNSEFHLGMMRAEADATRADAQAQIQLLSRDISPGPTPRELAILQEPKASAQLLALQAPAATRADRELVLQKLTHHSVGEDSESLLKHLNQTLDQDQRQWLASQVGGDGNARWVMARMLEMDQSRWKLPERAVVAERALEFLRNPDFKSQARGAMLRDMVVSAYAPTPLAPEQIQGFLEVEGEDPAASSASSEVRRQLAAHPDLPLGFLQKKVKVALGMQKERMSMMADGLDFPAAPHAEADSYMANPQVPEDVIRDYARSEIRNFSPDYGLPQSVTTLPKHRPEIVDQLAQDLYQSHWAGAGAQVHSPAGRLMAGTPGGILREAYIKPDNGYDIQPMPAELQQQIGQLGANPEVGLPHFASLALGRDQIRDEVREQLLTPERIHAAPDAREYVPSVMGDVGEDGSPEHDQWLEKMQLHANPLVQGFALRHSTRVNPGVAEIIRSDPQDRGQDIVDTLATRPGRPVPETVAGALAATVPQSRAAQVALMSMARNLNPGIKSEHLQPLLDLQGQEPPHPPAIQLRHEALSLPQITGDQLFRVITGPDAHRWARRLGEKTTADWSPDQRPGVEQALELHGHEFSREQQLQLVDNPLIYVAYHAAKNLHPEDMDAVLARSHRITTLQGILANKNVRPEHLQEIASRPGMATMLTIPAKEPDTSPQVLDQIYELRNRILAQGGDMDDLVGPLAKHKNASPELLKSLDRDLREVLTHGAKDSEGFDRDPWLGQLHNQAILRGPQLLSNLMQNPKMPMDQALDLGKWIQDLHPETVPEDFRTRPPPHPGFRRQWENQSPDRNEGWDQLAAWQQHVAHGQGPEWKTLTALATRLTQELHPDSRFKDRTRIRPGGERLREIRDLILDRNPQGQEFSPKHLPPGDWSAGRLPNGNISAQLLQQHLDQLPGQEYNLSNTHWSDDLQRHNAFPSKVLQVNVTTDQVQKLKHAGVWPTFKAMAEASRHSNHPVNDHTLGWVRFTGTPQHGFFIDEIQSDLGQSFVKQAVAQAQLRGLDPKEAAKRAESKYPEAHFQKIKAIVFGGRHPNQVLHEVFLQHLRDQGHVGVPVHMHTPQTKAPISSLDTKKPLPGHMLETYGDQPRKMGYRPVTYGSIAATSTKGPAVEVSEYDPYVPGAAHTKDQPLQPQMHAQVLVNGGEPGDDPVYYGPHASLPGATVQGTKIRKFESEARLWLLTKALPLQKMAIDPSDLKGVGKATNASLGQAQVDDSQEHTAHPALHEHVAQGFRSKVLDSPEVVRRGSAGVRESSNGTAKAIFDLKGSPLEGLGDTHRFMVKPYHEVIGRQARHWMHVPIQGWAEMTNQALYHAGNIGELHQIVHVQKVAYQKGRETQHGPTLVVHMAPGAKTVNQVGETSTEYSPQQQEQGRKIAIMDFLSNNLDRHSTNLLVLPEKDQLLVVDHSRSFQYKDADKMGDGLLDRIPNRGAGNPLTRADCMRQYLGYWQDGYQMGSSGLGSVLAHSVNDQLETPAEMQALKVKGWGPDQPSNSEILGLDGDEAKQARHDYLQWHQKAMEELDNRGRDEWSQAWEPAFQWFRENAEPVKRAFEQRLGLLKDERVRDHLRQNFTARWEALQRMKPGEAPKNWDLDPVTIFPPRRK